MSDAGERRQGSATMPPSGVAKPSATVAAPLPSSEKQTKRKRVCCPPPPLLLPSSSASISPARRIHLSHYARLTLAGSIHVGVRDVQRFDTGFVPSTAAAAIRPTGAAPHPSSSGSVAGAVAQPTGPSAALQKALAVARTLALQVGAKKQQPPMVVAQQKRKLLWGGGNKATAPTARSVTLPFCVWEVDCPVCPP
jgi:hypothetical protein